MFLACFFLSIGMALAQTTISGTVLSSEDGEPIVGASVMVESTKAGVATNIDGQFTLPVAAGARIIVSYLGMQTKVVKASANMKVYLDPVQNTIDEVMVVAYGTQKKSAFTGSAAVVKSEDIGKVQVTNAVDALKGKVSGVQMSQSSGQPGTSASLRIRGIGSINAGGTPLYIVDGVPFDGDLNTIGSLDIESLTVLKDAASAALYGARGANGVVIVTTKTGRADHATVTVDAKWGVNSRGVPEYAYITDPAAYYETWYKGLYNYATNKAHMSPQQATQWANGKLTGQDGFGLGYNVYTYPQGEYLIGSNGRLNPNATLGRMVTGKDGKQYWLTPDNWSDATYHNSLRQEYAVTAVGNTNKSTFYVSASYLNLDGITEASDYERFTGRLKADYQVKEWLKIGANVNYAHYNQNYLASEGDAGDSGNMFALTQMAPIYPLYMRDANKQIIYRNEAKIKAYDYGDERKEIGLIRPFMGQANALSAVQLDLNNTEGNTVNAVGIIEARFLKDFKFTSTNSVYLDEFRRKQMTNPYFGQYVASNGIISIEHGHVWSYNYQQLLNYKHLFGKHDVDVMLGHEYYRMTETTLSGSRSNMFSPSYTELSGAAVSKTPNSGLGMYNTEGWFSRVNYAYDDKYFGEFSFRRDASSRFHPKKHWGNFWSLGGAWIISKEAWFHAPWVDQLKFKASYGSQGNDNIGGYRYTNTFTITPSNGEVSVVKDIKGNKNISWEKQGMFNVGFDFSLFKQRLTGSIVYFDRSTTDMLAWVSLPGSYGWTGNYSNVGDMSNRGVEIELNGDIIRTQDLVWSANFNLTSYKNKIVSLTAENKTTVVDDGVWGYTSGDRFYGEGQSMATYYLPTYAGVDPNTGEALYYKDVYKKNEKDEIVKDENGVPILEKVITTTDGSVATQHLQGTALPDAYGGFGTGLQWKGIDFSIDFTYQLGGQVYDGGYGSSMGLNRGQNMHKDILNAWTPDNKNSNIPRLQNQDLYTNYGSSRWLVNASYLSLQNINLGYTLPKSITRGWGVESVRLYAMANNVWVWSKRQGLDPRQSMSGSVSNTSYSTIRTISGGFTLTF